jgi:hypothetical protein
MILENIYINFNEKLNISSISSYRIIMNKFVNKYIKLYSDNYSNTNELYSDALLYSKYYLYYKTQNCIYSTEIMEILQNVDYLN